MRVLRPVLAVGFLALMAGPVLAQERYATVDIRAGFTQPLGTAKDSLKGQSSFGAGAAIALGNRLHLGLSVDWAHHSQKQADGSVIGGVNDEQWNVVHTFLKASYNVVQEGRFTVGLNAGPGIMVFSPNQVLKDALGVRTDVHFAVNAGATITWWFADRIGLMASPQMDMAFKKTSGQYFKANSATMFPITGGFQFKI
jgi:hypothetical protein